MRPPRVFAVLLPVVMVAGLLAAVPAQATDAATASTTVSTSSATTLPAAPKGCRKGVGVAGFATIGGDRVRGAKVRVFARGAHDKVGEFHKELRVSGVKRTNRMGGFFVSVECLPKTFVVTISRGRIHGDRNKDSLSALGRRGERGVVVTPATSVAVAYAQRQHVNAIRAVKRTTKFLKVVDLGNEVTQLGAATWVRAATFSPSKYANQAVKAGGIQKFAKQLAKQMSKKKHHSFKPKGYTKTYRPGFPKAGSDGSPRTRGKHLRSTMQRGGATSILYSVAGKAAFNATCALLPPSPPTNLACASPGSSQDAEIENQLTAISDQLTALQQSVNDIISTLNVMESQLTEIQNTLDEIEAQNANSLQVQLQSSAATAQQQYQDAYSYAGVSQIQSIVQDATYDLNILGTIAPNTTWSPVAPGSTNQAMCETMYSSLNISSGQNPLGLCTDFLTQVQAFADPSNAYFSVLYKSLVGSSGLPEDDLLVWTYQEMLTLGANTPVPSTTVASVQSSAGQLGALMDNAYALLAAGQLFEYGATTGQSTTCPDLTTSGTFPASTTITVADACSTLETGLFTAAVQNDQALGVAVPPSGSIADPRTNYVWWSYPVDLTASTASSGSFPFWPGAPSGTYTTATGSPLQLWAYTNAYNPACCTSDWLWTFGYAYQPLLPASTSYDFYLANQTQNQTLFNNLLLTDPASLTGSLGTSGFQGIGQTQYGMQWVNLGVDPMVTAFYSTYLWQTSTPMPSSQAACVGYPATQKGSFSCSAAMNFEGKTLPGQQGISAIMATQYWNLAGSQLPDATTVQSCPQVGTVYNWSTDVTNNVSACEQNVFGLLVDTSAGTGGSGELPPFWSVSMLNGPNENGVPAVTVPPPTPVTATS